MPIVRVNAFTGEDSPTSLLDLDGLAVRGWVKNLGFVGASSTGMGPPPPENWNDYTDPRVGFGVVTSPGAHLPDSIAELCRARAPTRVFSFHVEEGAFFLLDERGQRRSLEGPIGVGTECVPYYLLILGAPSVVPWRLQYLLGANRCVGRLPFDGTALDNYVAAVLSGFAGATANPRSVVAWAVDHGAHDITHGLRRLIAEKVHEEYSADTDYAEGVVLIGGADSGLPATGAVLAAELERHVPALIITTSHGMNGPLRDSQAMLAQLGMPVDQDKRPLDLTRLTSTWQPDGAIWYAHACSSAGCDSLGEYVDLFDEHSDTGKLVRKIASLGSQVAPLPLALLGARRPLRAFIGHVEPTFDWTLSHPDTGENLSAPIARALYQGLAGGEPVGAAFRAWHARTGILRGQFDEEGDRFDRRGGNLARLLYLKLAARDSQATVILGDPTVVMARPN